MMLKRPSSYRSGTADDHTALREQALASTGMLWPSSIIASLAAESAEEYVPVGQRVRSPHGAEAREIALPDSSGVDAGCNRAVAGDIHGIFA
jgi:hypothetical protein